MNFKALTLLTLCNGSVPELFDRELLTVMQNIVDPNTDPKAKRRITITIDFFPHKDRQQCDISADVVGKIAPVAEKQGSMHIGRTPDGKPKAFTTDINQSELYPTPEEKKEPAQPFVRESDSA